MWMGSQMMGADLAGLKECCEVEGVTGDRWQHGGFKGRPLGGWGMGDDMTGLKEDF